MILYDGNEYEIFVDRKKFLVNDQELHELFNVLMKYFKEEYNRNNDLKEEIDYLNEKIERLEDKIGDLQD
jgi:tRNA(Phe) wybutosine-synthesizing methylase Tyw3